MRKIYLLYFFLFVFIAARAQNAAKPIIKIFSPGVSFTCITVDSANRVWAGTNANGFVRIVNDKPQQIKITANNFGAVSIKHMAADRDKGIWVAHEGYSTTYGGVDYLDAKNPANRRHYGSVSRLSTVFKGLPSRRTQSIAVDKNGKVWTANSYHDLTAPGGNPYYLVNPGGMGFKTPSMLTFDTIPNGLEPYPAYTVNTPISQSAGTRVCPSVGVDPIHNEVWLGGAAYNAVPVFQGSRISRWNLAGTFLGQFDETNSPLPLGNINNNARPIAIYFDKSGNGWVAFNQAKGFGVKNNTGWTYVGLPSVLPAGTNINQNAISGNKKGEVFIGTTAGLLKYRGVGALTSDTSYVLYTAALNGLPSDNITGVTVDKGGTIWMCTPAGICKMFTADLLMYNLKPTSGAYITESEALRRVVAYFGTGIQTNETTLISADGSNATLFKWQGSNPNNLKFRIKEDPDGNNPNEYGSFFLRFRDPLANDSIKVQYTHPKFVDELYTVSGPGGREITLEVVDTTVTPGLVVLSEKVRVVLPPVLMLHGIWSDGSAFDQMKQYLLTNGTYKYKDFQLTAPSYTNDVSFEENKDVVLYASRDLIEVCANNRMSAGKVDIVAHSMGGILSRIFLQSDYYEKTIHKLITLNTPHSGSQAANVMINNPVVFRSLKYINGSIRRVGFDPSRGAANDLQVNSEGTRQLLNGASLNKNTVPAHAIVTKDERIKNGELKLWLKGIASDAVSLAFGKKVPYKTALIAVVKEIATMNTSCSFFELVHSCMKDKLFHDDNDWIVAVKSQEGGLPETAVSRFNDIMHTQVEGNNNVFFKIHDLLRKKDNDKAFFADGYNPLTLEYDGALNRPGSVTNESIHINEPVAGQTYTAGKTINIDISGSTNIKSLMYLAGNASLGISLDDTTLQNNVFSYTIPANAAGRINIFAIGYDSDGKATADSSFINVLLPENVSLDSIRVADKNIKIYQGDSVAMQINGYFTDTVRDISGVSGISYSSEETNAEGAASNYIKALNIGFDRIIITYNGSSDTVYVEVIEKPLMPEIVLPITLSSFAGKFVNSAIRLTWTTAQEANNHHFEIERSSDGILFESVGQVGAYQSGFSGTTYIFNDLSFKPAANFYRLKQVDIDGTYTYSDIILVKLPGNKNASPSIYPNPAKNVFHIRLAQTTGAGWQINIYSTPGQLVFTKKMSGGQEQADINISFLPKGMYHLVLREQDGRLISCGKLIKQ